MKATTLASCATVLGACLPLSAVAAAEPGGEGNLPNRAAVASPGRVVLDKVPPVRYLKDGLCPFALCLKALTDALGESYAYSDILGASGACFRMAWNDTAWDEGNMDLGRLGPEPFRRGLRAVGLQHRFLLRRSWWPDAAGDDIQILADDPAAAADVLRHSVVQSLRDGVPVLAFGVVGPPEVSIVCGYDDDGRVLIGWAAMDGEHPPDQREPNGMFRQRDWFARTQGLIVVTGRIPGPHHEMADLEALGWAFEVATRPRSRTHVFGQAAYRGWAEAMLRDHAFPTADEGVLQQRRHTVWDGLIMLAERREAAALIDRIAAVQPDIAAPLHEAARQLARDGDGTAICRALGGHMLPGDRLADPCARRLAADAILRARDANRAALDQLAVALGKERIGFAFAGKELSGLRMARRWMTLLGSVQGCLRYLGKDVDDAWLYGVTGAAFMLNIDRDVDVSGPTSWEVESEDGAAPAQFVRMMPHLGASLTDRVRSRTTAPDFAEQQAAARRFIEQKIDAGIPCYAWYGGFPEYSTLNGYNHDGLLVWTHYLEGGYKAIPWSQLGRNDTDCFEVRSVEPCEPVGDDRATVRAALCYALDLARTAPAADGRNAQGLAGYDLWIRCLETGGWRRPGLPGVHHNAACWHECRCYAERFLRLAGARLGGDQQPRFARAADHYRAVRLALCELQGIFIYRYPLPPVDEAGVRRAVELLRAAKAAEIAGLAVIQQIVAEMPAAAAVADPVPERARQ